MGESWVSHSAPLELFLGDYQLGSYALAVLHGFPGKEDTSWKAHVFQQFEGKFPMCNKSQDQNSPDR